MVPASLHWQAITVTMQTIPAVCSTQSSEGLNVLVDVVIPVSVYVDDDSENSATSQKLIDFTRLCHTGQGMVTSVPLSSMETQDQACSLGANETLSDSSCKVPTELQISNSGPAPIPDQCTPTFFSSFHCWANTQPEPNAKGDTPTMASTATFVTAVKPTFLPYTNVSSVITATPMQSSAMASIAASLSGYFDPFSDDLLLCGDDTLYHCFNYNSSGSCGTLPSPSPYASAR